MAGEDYPESGFKLPTTFAVILPTLDWTGYLPLITQIYETARILKRPMALNIPNRWGVHNSMHQACQELGKALKTDRFRGLVVGSDTHIVNPSTLAEYIDRADKEGVSFIGNMKLNMGPSETSSPLIGDVSDWVEITPPGYGLYYGDLWASYNYHNDIKTGEDGYFLIDNFYSRGSKVRYAKNLQLLHYVRKLV